MLVFECMHFTLGRGCVVFSLMAASAVYQGFISLCLDVPQPSWRWRDCNVSNGQYRYLTDLLALDQCRPDGCHNTAREAPMAGPAISLACLDAWRSSLESHPTGNSFATFWKGLVTVSGSASTIARQGVKKPNATCCRPGETAR